MSNFKAIKNDSHTNYTHNDQCQRPWLSFGLHHRKVRTGKLSKENMQTILYNYNLFSTKNMYVFVSESANVSQVISNMVNTTKKKKKKEKSMYVWGQVNLKPAYLYWNFFDICSFTYC